MLVRLHDPRQKLAEERKGRIGHDDVRLVAEALHLVAAEIAVAVEVLPFEVFDVDPAVGVGVVVEDEDLAVGLALVGVIVRVFGLEERRLPRLYLLALYGVTGADELF